MIINFFPAIYHPEPLSILILIIIILLMLFTVGYLVYSLIRQQVNISKYKRRVAALAANAFYSLYLMLNQCIKPTNVMNIHRQTYILTIVLPQLILGVLSSIVYSHLINFSSQLNVTFIFSSTSNLFALILFLASIQNAVFNIAFAFVFPNSVYLCNFFITSILFDAFSLIFIIYPTIKLLLSTFKLDSLQLMRKKTIAVFAGTIFFIICICIRMAIVVFIGLPEIDIDNDTRRGIQLIFYVGGSKFYASYMFFLFLTYGIYYACHLLYLDSIIISVEGTADSSVSVYLAASEHIE